jgi:hypothetical protein
MGIGALIRRSISRVLGVAGAISLAASLAACGEQEATFTAQEFVAEANRNGAGLELGGPVNASGAEDEIYGLAVEPTGEPSAEGRAEDGAAVGESHEHGGGSLRVTESDSAAREEHARCESAASLLCYRAANIVVIFEPELSPADLARFAEALRAMGSSS